jgi:heat shock protein HslJ
MVSKRQWRSLSWLVFALVLVTPAAAPAKAAEREFPFGSELMLDAAPLYGSKRVPMIEIDDNGTASIDLWCASVRGEATVGETSITIVAEPPTGAQCTPERQSGDQDLLTALTQVTSWRRDGDVIEFSGPTPLRFRLMTN